MSIDREPRVKTVKLVSLFSTGHRSSYNSALKNALLKYQVKLSEEAPRSEASFFPMIDDGVIAFSCTAVTNMLLGKHTAGLFFRPAECFKTEHLKYRFKRALFRIVRSIPRTTILTILPHSIDARFAQVSNGWIYDPQLWDLAIQPASTEPGSTELIEQIAAFAAGRKVVVALGSQKRIKGFDFFAELWTRNASIREQYFFVSAGAIAPECKSAAAEFRSSHGLTIDRFVSDDELLRLYDAADIIWSCYAPDYDQASGIFGRAFQSGKPALVRDGSFLVRLAKQLDHPVLSLSQDRMQQSVTDMLTWAPTSLAPATLQSKIEIMRRRDSETLVKAFGFCQDAGRTFGDF